MGQIFRIEEEQFVLGRVELPRPVNGSADIGAFRVEAVLWLYHSIGVVEETVGVELLVALVVICCAVKVLGARLRHAADDSAAVTPVFRVVVVQEDFHLADGVHVYYGHNHIWIADMLAGQAVNGNRVGGRGTTANDWRGHRTQPVPVSNAVGDHTRQCLEQGGVIPSAYHEGRQLRTGQ